MSETKSEQEEKSTPSQMLMEVFGSFAIDLDKLEAIAELLCGRNGEVYAEGLSGILYDLHRAFRSYLGAIEDVVAELKEAKEGAA